MGIVVGLLILVGLVLFDLVVYLFGTDSRDFGTDPRLLGQPRRWI